jgi:endonuclease III
MQFQKTAGVRSLNMRGLRRKSHHVAAALHKVHGSPNHANKQDPMDELIFIVLSQMTTHKALVRVYDNLKLKYDNWDRLSVTSIRRLKHLIHHAGLANHKAVRIKSIAARIKNEFGTVSLHPLRLWSDSEVERFLTSLPGVGIKTAKCVMLFSLNRQVLPVDTHVMRVSRRLGLVNTPDNFRLEQIVAPEDRYSFHVNVVAHGRATCQAIRPNCSSCSLQTICFHVQGKL